jgi:hypothetical protein
MPASRAVRKTDKLAPENCKALAMRATGRIT